MLELLANRALLDENIFSLELLRTVKDQGEFFLGATNPDCYTGGFVMIELPNDSDVAPLLKEPLIVLLRELVEIITNIIGAKKWLVYPEFNRIQCDTRAYLPELTSNVSGYNFTIDTFGYASNVEAPYNNGTSCLV
ncbi:hypothetical protein K469DRAFT_682699 [Zopfia rhizophila CBS 207.26]|uniref:Uncharacterized protein n=1 Tax=Zopfia rhizophila CBS 207.26 TaxID=1314779 RepID=A0A6A6DCX3_9PEZI|nr:hypothetical protein K469DRAFT_682699 [Zopfia rhizophila CBS 207.26]